MGCRNTQVVRVRSPTFWLFLSNGQFLGYIAPEGYDLHFANERLLMPSLRRERLQETIGWGRILTSRASACPLLNICLAVPSSSFDVDRVCSLCLQLISMLWAQVAEWQNEQLPSDQISVENGGIITQCQRWPLIIDPQLQGMR